MIPYVDKLKELAALRNAGVLSEENYTQQKQILLNLLHEQRKEQTTQEYTDEELEEYTLQKSDVSFGVHHQQREESTISDRTLVPEEALKGVISWEKGAFIHGYELIKVLGQGGHGVVWSAKDPKGKYVAIKSLRFLEQDLLERFEREIDIQSEFHSPFIVPVLDQFSYLGQPVMVMEQISGLGLSQFVARKEYQLKEVESIIEGLLEATDTLHAKGYIHRDIKPDNILIQNRMGIITPKLTDFGIVKEQQLFDIVQEERSGYTMGTPGFMAPEQCTNFSTVDERADIFSIGAVMYFLCTKKRAFTGVNHFELIQRSCDGHFIPPQNLVFNLPLRMQHAIVAALEPEPQKRPKNIDELHSLWIGENKWVGFSTFLNKANLRETTPLYPQDLSKGNLIISEEVFIGRKVEIQTLKDQVQKKRLLGVYGAPGIGKTRIIQQTVCEMYEQFSGGIWYFDLSLARTKRDILELMASVFSIPSRGKDVQEKLRFALLSKSHTLLIFDGGEHVNTVLSELITEWVSQVLHMNIVVSMRMKPSIAAGDIMRILPLSAADGEELFIQHAKKHKKDFMLRIENQEQIREIVHKVDRIPLAICLVSAQLNKLPLDLIYSRLIRKDADETYPLQKMDSALSWSFSLLHPFEREVLFQCSIFEDGFTMEAAEKVIYLDDEQAPYLMDIIHNLVDQSWISVRKTPLGNRLYLFDMIQQFLLQQADDVVIKNRELKNRFCAYFSRFGENSFVDYKRGKHAYQARLELNLEKENVKKCADISVRYELYSLLPMAVVSYANYLTENGKKTLILPHLEKIDPERLADDTNRYLFYNLCGDIYDRCGQLEKSERTYKKALQLPIAAERVSAQLNMAYLYFYQNRYDEALQCLISIQDKVTDGQRRIQYGKVCNQFGLIYKNMGDRQKATSYFLEAISVYREVESDINLATVLLNLSGVYSLLGYFEKSNSLLEEAKIIHENMDNKSSLGLVLGNLGYNYSKMGDDKKAIELSKKSLRIFQETGNRLAEGIELAGMGSIFIRLAFWEKAEKFLMDAHEILKTRHPSKWGEAVSMIARIRSMRGVQMENELEEAYNHAQKRITCHIEFLFQQCFYHYNLNQKDKLQIRVDHLTTLIHNSELSSIGIYKEYPQIVQELLREEVSWDDDL